VFHSTLFKIKKKSGPILSLSLIKRKEKKEKDPVKIALTCWISSSSRYVTQQQRDRERKYNSILIVLKFPQKKTK
jgi:hypothetical protein